MIRQQGPAGHCLRAQPARGPPKRRTLATPPLGLRLTKDPLNAPINTPSLTTTLALEGRIHVMTINGPDLAEGLAAMQEQRPPNWK